MRKVLALILSGLLLFSVPAYAADGDPAVDAGITPDSILYTADKLIEDIQLALTFDDQKDADLLLQFAQERLAEAKVMTEQEKTEFVQTAVNDYLAILQQAEDKVMEVVADETESQEVKDELTQELDETTQVDEEVQNNLGDEQQEELGQQTGEISFTANVVKGIDAAVVKSLRDKGLGFGQIAHTVALAEASGKTVDEISTLIIDGKKGMGELAKELGIHPSQMNPKAKTAKQDESDGQDQTGVQEGTDGQEGTSDLGEAVEPSTGTEEEPPAGSDEAVVTPAPEQPTIQAAVSSTSTVNIETSVESKDISTAGNKIDTKDSKINGNKNKSKDLKESENKSSSVTQKQADKGNSKKK